jgi:hypothetical protein
MTIDAFSYQSWDIFLAGNVQEGESIQIYLLGENIKFYSPETLWSL